MPQQHDPGQHPPTAADEVSGAADGVTVPELTPGSTVDDLVRVAMARGLDDLLRHGQRLRCAGGAGRRIDERDVHQARVATRRLRAALRDLSGVVPEREVDGARSELRWLASLLGAVRDVDVLASLLQASARDLDRAGPATDGTSGSASEGAEPGPAGLDELLALLEERRRLAQLTLLDAMGSSRYQALLDRLHRLADQPPLADGVDGSAPAGPVARHVVVRAARRVHRYGRRLDRRPGDEELHTLRKRAKRARYAAQLSAPVLGRDATKLAKRLSRLQDELGAHQDQVTLRRWLDALPVARLSPQAAFTAGRLHHLATQRAAEAPTWCRHWREARRRARAL